MIASEAMQRRVASIALAATNDSGFALAGSGAIREHGFTCRPTADVDLFTDRRDAGGFERALGDVIAQLASEGFVVTVARRFELFARLRVTLDGEVVEVDLGVDWRARQPVVLALGPVLDEYDAVSCRAEADRLGRPDRSGDRRRALTRHVSAGPPAPAPGPRASAR